MAEIAGAASPAGASAAPSPWAMLGSLLYHTLRAVLLAVLEGARLLVGSLVPWPRALASRCGAVEFYEGRVHHSRLAPARHTFTYAVRYCLIDLDAVGPATYAASQLRHGARLSADAARALSGCSGRVRLLVLPASAGYEQNPLAIYYCYERRSDGDGEELRCGIAEVDPTGDWPEASPSPRPLAAALTPEHIIFIVTKRRAPLSSWSNRQTAAPRRPRPRR